MNLYLLSQDVNNGYDTYDSCVVAAPNESAAIRIHPSSYSEDSFNEVTRSWDKGRSYYYKDWADTCDQVSCRLIGKAEDGIVFGVVCASFNAG